MSRAPRHVLVTGAGGRIGRAVVERLLASGVAVTGLDARYDRPTGASRDLVGDVRDPDVVAPALDGVDGVVHLAAIPHPSLGSPYEVFTTNVVGTYTVLETAGQAGVRRAVIASSINAIGVPNNPHRPMPGYLPIDEEIPADVADAYSLSKLVDERTAAAIHRRWGTVVVALRFPLTAPADLLASAALEARADPDATVREGWSYLDVRDAAVAVEAALRADVAGAEVLHLAAPDTTLGGDLAAAVERYAPGVPWRASRPVAGLVDASRAQRVLGVTPSHLIERNGTP